LRYYLVDAKCFRGGNQIHQDELDNAIKSLNKCCWVYDRLTKKVPVKNKKPAPSKTQVGNALAALGLVVASVGLIAIAVADPEPVSKVMAAGLSYAATMALLNMLGVTGENENGA
jgi:hypothetical protein